MILPTFALIDRLVLTPTGDVVMVNLRSVSPWATMRVDFTKAMDGLVLVNSTLVPPGGAGPLRCTRASVLCPLTTELGTRPKATSPGVAIVITALFEMAPTAAVMVTEPDCETGTVVMPNVMDV